MAIESPWIQAEIIEANEFYNLAKDYNVSGVPQITINEGENSILGAVPEDSLIEEIQRVVKLKP